MPEQMLWTIVILGLVNVALVVALYQRSVRAGEGAAKEVREELRAAREEARGAGKELREEVTASLKAANDGLMRTLEAMGKGLQAQAEATARGMREFAQAQGEALAKTLEAQAKGQQERIDALAQVLKRLVETNDAALERMRGSLDARVKELQEGNERKLDALRKESADGQKAAREEFMRALEAANKAEGEKLESVAKALKELGETNGAAMERARATLDARVKELQEGNERRLDEVRKESAAGLKAANETLAKTLETQAKAQGERLEEMSRQVRELTAGNQGAMDRIRGVFDQRLKELQEGNERKLDEMRKTVDEKLHVTLEKRLGESFKFVSDRLEAVHKGLGEMQTLATGVGDLKRVLSNVKVRGTWAEVQLGAILEQLLAPGQWERNVAVKEGSAERVEFAIRLPGPQGDPDARVWLPIDSKFPQEDYLRLQEAVERGDVDATREALDAVSRAVKVAAKDIHDKYLEPPATTDFAIMYLATEGLFAEVVRQPALVDELQQRYRVAVAGPTTLAALLSSLRMGFQTLSIERRATEVWRVLGAVKTEFGKFGEALDKVKRNLATATKTIEATGVRSRAMARQLRAVESLPETEAETVLELPPAEATTDGDDEA